eukprot:TRINITY_DN5641_c0_g1_i1.p1 TRINITY_DN5641_c0_g1~~TRINITY_DN5641_c0_g1_i1.p1  ORF type:complete len:294 (-),score=51.46 TRINITY_DN5641_c0_g1_i1:534-1415(-)
MAAATANSTTTAPSVVDTNDATSDRRAASIDQSLLATLVGTFIGVAALTALLCVLYRRYRRYSVRRVAVRRMTTPSDLPKSFLKSPSFALKPAKSAMRTDGSLHKDVSVAFSAFEPVGVFTHREHVAAKTIQRLFRRHSIRVLKRRNGELIDLDRTAQQQLLDMLWRRYGPRQQAAARTIQIAWRRYRAKFRRRRARRHQELERLQAELDRIPVPQLTNARKIVPGEYSPRLKRAQSSPEPVVRRLASSALADTRRTASVADSHLTADARFQQPLVFSPRLSPRLTMRHSATV